MDKYKHAAYLYIIKVIKSCTKYSHNLSCSRMVKTFHKRYQDDKLTEGLQFEISRNLFRLKENG